ncbi:MAG TPA: MurR/RpiR family transcriptional regulator [Casimicrobiaceae bacterium]|jgi:DNA-binding MurR/RpiR family transcriptional regulator|nr:MurR/RpiR family transcriptional regulator [Casimicrobiaceae bacterium]
MVGATRYDDLARAIADAYPALPNRLQGLARYALDNPDAMALATVAEIARDADVPPSAVIRFANAMGYDGYLPMQRVYRERLVARSATYRERIKALRASAEDPGDLVRPLIDSAIGELERLREHLDRRTLKAAASLVVRARNIHVIAQRRAFPIATYMVYALAQLELRAQLLDNTGGMLKTHAALIGKEDLLIAASFRNYAPEVVEVAGDCHKRGVPVIAFTDTPVSPLAAVSKVRFDVGDNFTLPFRSLVGSMTAAQALVIAIGYAQGERKPRPKGAGRPA